MIPLCTSKDVMCPFHTIEYCICEKETQRLLFSTFKLQLGNVNSPCINMKISVVNTSLLDSNKITPSAIPVQFI